MFESKISPAELINLFELRLNIFQHMTDLLNQKHVKYCKSGALRSQME